MKVLAVLILALPVVVQPKTPVRFTCDCTDPAGLLFASAIRDAIAESPRLQESSLTDGWAIDAVSVDPDGSGESTAVSMVVMEGRRYVTHRVQVCGKHTPSSCAAHTLAFLDQQMHGQ